MVLFSVRLCACVFHTRKQARTYVYVFSVCTSSCTTKAGVGCCAHAHTHECAHKCVSCVRLRVRVKISLNRQTYMCRKMDRDRKEFTFLNRLDSCTHECMHVQRESKVNFFESPATPYPPVCTYVRACVLSRYRVWMGIRVCSHLRKKT